MPFDGISSKYGSLEVLKGARNRLARPNGWCQKSLISGDSVCLLGAIMLQHPDLEDNFFRREAERYVAKVLPKEFCKGPYAELSIFAFNDSTGCSQDQVVAVVDKAIELLET
jgi:hypothetical protein